MLVLGHGRDLGGLNWPRRPIMKWGNKEKNGRKLGQGAKSAKKLWRKGFSVDEKSNFWVAEGHNNCLCTVCTQFPIKGSFFRKRLRIVCFPYLNDQVTNIFSLSTPHNFFGFGGGAFNCHMCFPKIKYLSSSTRHEFPRKKASFFLLCGGPLRITNSPLLTIDQLL